MVEQLHHLTLTTGHMAVTTRADISRHTIDHMLPIIDAGRAEIKPLEGVFFDSLRPVIAEDPPAGPALFASTWRATRTIAAPRCIAWRAGMPRSKPGHGAAP